jgi:glutamate/tyrosine decarboxylase-like PLP-dependent enzyme
MCEVIGVESIEIPSLDNGKMNLNALEQELQKGTIGTVVATLGTTGIGAVDPLHEIISLCKKYNARVHADCAYGGFFTILAHAPNPIIDPIPFLALNNADSIVVDPHKHGLQPYGCGSILFKDSSVGKYYKHDSPYTYFTSKNLHLGEISLECSRAGASAAALWAALKYFPLHHNEGLGTILSQTREAALLWNDSMNNSQKFKMFTTPELDIVTYFPVTKEFSSDSTSEASRRIFTEGMNKKEKPLYLATYVVDSHSIKNKFPEFSITSEKTTILRSVLMKPEQKNFVKQFVKELEETV